MFALKRCVTMSVLCGVLCTGVWAQDSAQVHGVLATRVQFSDEAGEKLAAATLELLASCTASGLATEKDFQDAPARTCHLHLTLAKPHVVTMANSPAFAVDEVVMTFPLSSARLWVRSGDQYHWFAKFRPNLCGPIQELLKEAVPGEQRR